MKFFKKDILGVIFVCVVMAGFIWKRYIVKLNLNWDEAHFLYWAYQTYQAIRNWDLDKFLKVTLEQNFYPPLQSWVFSLGSLLWGFSVEKARVFSLGWFILSGILIYKLTLSAGRKIILQKKWLKAAGWMGLFFWLTSPLVIFYASSAFKEIMGAFFFLMAGAIYFKAREKNNPFLFFSLGFFLFLIFFLKYNYGILMALILGLETVIHILKERDRKKAVLEGLLIFIPFIWGILFWIFIPDNKWGRITEVLLNAWDINSKMVDAYTIWLFYPRGVLYLYSYSVFWGFFLLVSSLVSFRWIKQDKIRVLLLGIWINFFLGIRNSHNLQERYILTTIPYLFILGGLVFAKIGEVFQKKSGNRRGVGILLMALLILFTGRDFIKLPDYVYTVGAYAGRSAVFNQTDYTDQLFKYDREKWAQRLPEGDFERPYEVVSWIVERMDLSKPVEVVGQTAELSPDYFKLEIAIRRDNRNYTPQKGYNKFIATIELLPDSKLRTWDYYMFSAYMEKYVNEIYKDKNNLLLAEKIFPQLGVRARVYGRR